MSYMLSFSGWLLASEKKECGGSEVFKGKYAEEDFRSCANACSGIASMFLFQRREYCQRDVNGHCECFCETSANSDGTCHTKSADFHNLYAYTGNYG